MKSITYICYLFLVQRISVSSLSAQQRSHFLQLFEQREFVLSYLFSTEKSPFPRVRGTCAHLFIVEETDTELGTVNHWPLIDRLKVAVKLIDLVIVSVFPHLIYRNTFQFNL